MKIKTFLVSVIVAALLCSCTKQLDVSVEYNTRNPNDAPVLYWVNNNTGADIPAITYTLNLATVPGSENISQNRDVLSWSKEIAAENIKYWDSEVIDIESLLKSLAINQSELVKVLRSK